MLYSQQGKQLDLPHIAVTEKEFTPVSYEDVCKHWGVTPDPKVRALYVSRSRTDNQRAALLIALAIPKENGQPTIGSLLDLIMTMRHGDAGVGNPLR